MKKIFNIKILIMVLVFAVNFVLGWYLLNSILFGIVLAAIATGITFYIFKVKAIDDEKYKNIESAYTFVNMMNIEMIVSKSVYEAYKNSENYLTVDFANILNEDLHNQLIDIAGNYQFNGFKMYIKTLVLYDDEGGVYDYMEKIPTSIVEKSKINYTKLKKQKTSKLIDITILYLLWIFIMIFLKSALADYYDLMMEEFTYQILMLLILVVGIGMYGFTIVGYFKNNIKGL